MLAPARMILALFLFAGVAVAHEHWILLESDGDRASVRICSGHAFPASEMLLSERLLVETAVVDPQGASARFKPDATNKVWVAPCAFDRPGVWSAAFALKKPQEEEPLYRGRYLLVVGGTDDPSRYASGKGLEIVPQSPLSALKPGSLLPVAIHLDGAPIEGKIEVTPARGSVAFFTTGKDRPAEIKLPSSGVYLLTASHRGKTFALTFAVAAPAGSPP